MALLGGGAAASDVAAAAMEATQQDLEKYTNDPALLHAFWLLLQVPIAARGDDFRAALQAIGIEVASASPSAAELASAFTQAVDHAVNLGGIRSELGEMAEMAAVEVLVESASERN